MNATPAELARLIRIELDAIAAAWRDERQAADDAAKREAFCRGRIAQNRSRIMQQQAAEDFAASRGWRLSDRPFGLVTLQRGKQHSGGRDNDVGRGWFPGAIAGAFDHCQWFKRDRKAAGITAHLYRGAFDRAQCEAIARQFGLTFEVPDFPSWHNPGGTILVCYTGSGGLP